MNIKSMLNPISWTERKIVFSSVKDVKYLDIGCRYCDEILHFQNQRFAKYVGVDADEMEIQRLQNKYLDRADLSFINCAVHSLSGQDLWLNIQSDVTTSYTSETPGKDSKKVISKTVDEIIIENFNEPIDILSIDIEGNSGAALAGCINSLTEGQIQIIQVELLANNISEFRKIFQIISKFNYRLFCVNETSRYSSKGITQAKPVPFLFDLTFVRNDHSDRQTQLLQALGYSIGYEEKKTSLLNKTISVFVDFIVHLLKRSYPRAYYRTVETDAKTLFKK